MRFLTGRLLLLAHVILISSVGLAKAEPNYRERVEHFDISGHVNSKRDMWNAIRDWGPSRSLNQYVVGQAKPRFHYKFKYRKRNGRCTFTKLDVGVQVVLRLPAWDLKDFAKPELKQYFGCILRTVTVHEKRHAQIAYEAGERVEARFLNQLSGTACNGFEDRAKQSFEQVIADHHRRQADFDRRDYARKRYQLCDSGSAGPSANVNSRPKSSRHAAKSVPTRRFDREPPAKATGNIRTRARAAKRRSPPSPTSATDNSGEATPISFETTRRLIGSAGVMAIAAATICALFIGFMWFASRYEKRRELESLADGSSSDKEPSIAPRSPSRQTTQRSTGNRPRPVQSGGFGKRGLS